MAPHPVYLGFRLGSALARLAPAAAVDPVANVLGAIGTRVMGERADMVRRHQRRVRPELTERQLDEAVRATFESYGHYWVESFRLPGTTPEQLDARFEVEDFSPIQDAIDAGAGIILALPHLGGWEWAGFWLTAVKHMEVSVVAEVIEPPELAAWFIGLRQQFGLDIIPLDASAGTRSSKALGANRILCLLCDRDIAGTGVEVTFFGETTTLPGGPATLALRSGAPLIPAGVFLDGDTHRAVLRPAIDTTRHGRLREDVARVTQDLAVELEHLIRLAPDQWHLMQPNWPSDREDGP